MPRFNYTPAEYTDMILIYGECHGNASLAIRTYRERYGNSRHCPSDCRVILGAIQRLRDNQRLVPRTEGAPPLNSVRRDEKILDYVAKNPMSSLRQTARNLKLNHKTVSNVIKRFNDKPVRFRKVQIKAAASNENSEEISDTTTLIQRTVARRTSSTSTMVQKYKDGSEESSDSEPELLDNKIESDRDVPEPMSDDDFTVKKNNKKKPADIEFVCLDSLNEDIKEEELSKSNEKILTTVLSSDIKSVPESPPKKKPDKKQPAKRKLMNSEKEKPKPRKRQI